MNIKMDVTRVLIQASLTQVFIFVYNFYLYQSLEQAAVSVVAIVFLTGLYGGTLGIILLGRGEGLLKILVVSFLTSFLVTLTFVIYPQQLGLVVEWWVLFLLLFISGLIAYGLSYDPHRRKNNEVQ